MRPIQGDLKLLARGNHVLKEVPFEEFDRLINHMQLMEVDGKEVLHQAGEPIRHVFFPITALMSMLIHTSEGETVELATVGREGLTGTSMLLNGFPGREHGTMAKVITIIPGSVVMMKSEIFRDAVDTSLSVARCLRGYLSLLFTELALSVICNRLHSLEQRCARWLLGGVDKSGNSEIPVTQETLAGILGASRQSIAQTISVCEKRNMIRRGRGSIRVDRRDALMTITCECYEILKRKVCARQELNRHV